METIRAILIDPVASDITEVNVPSDLDAIKTDFIRCTRTDVIDFGEGVSAWFDRDAMEGPPNEQGYTEFCHSVVIAGRVVLTGITPDGNVCALHQEIDVPFMVAMARFIPANEVKGRNLTSQATKEEKTPKCSAKTKRSKPAKVSGH